MPKEKWLIDPSELDKIQRDILDLELTDSYVVTGCAGSGKTLLALFRANDICIDAMVSGDETPSFTMIVYTRALRSFIRSGILELKIPIHQVIHYEKWDGSEVDHVIVDEAQDFTQEEIEMLIGAGIKSIMLYGDTQQQVYTEKKGISTVTIEEIAKHLGKLPKELPNNYRLPKPVASFASHIGIDKDLELRCVKEGSNKPKVKRFSSWEQELDYIIREIQTRNFTDVAILLPFNVKDKAPRNNFHRNIATVNEYFEKVAFSHEYKVTENNSDGLGLDFDSNLPKVMSYHNSKGLQFETVFIPFCDYPGHDQWFITKYQNPLFVGLTRTYKNLYITHTDELTPFFKGLPSNKYE
jgi:superfamily I DNA/RNA helicase